MARDTKAYPIVITKGQKFFIVDIPDFGISTQGNDIAECIEMARDAIGITGLDMLADGEDLPLPSSAPIDLDEGSILNYVDVNFIEYGEKLESKTVKKNCTLPYWLCSRAEKQNINFSKALQEALLEKLHLA